MTDAWKLEGKKAGMPGSLEANEAEILLYFSDRLGYFDGDSYNKLKSGYRTQGKLLWRFYQKVKSD